MQITRVYLALLASWLRVGSWITKPITLVTCQQWGENAVGSKHSNYGSQALPPGGLPIKGIPRERNTLSRPTKGFPGYIVLFFMNRYGLVAKPGVCCRRAQRFNFEPGCNSPNRHLIWCCAIKYYVTQVIVVLNR